MAVILPDIFGSMLKGERAAVKDNWEDLNQYEGIERQRTANDRDNLSLLGESYDFAGERAIAGNKVNKSQRENNLGEVQHIGQVFDAAANNVHSGAKYAVTADNADNIGTMYATVAPARINRTISDARMYDAQTGIRDEYAPGALANYGNQLGAQQQVDAYNINNLFPNAQLTQEEYEATKGANIAAGNYGEAQARSNINIIPSSEAATIAGNEYSTASSNMGVDLIPVQTEAAKTAFQAQTANNTNVINAAPLTGQVQVATLQKSLNDLENAPEIEKENRVAAIYANLAQNSQAKNAAVKAYNRALSEGRTAEAEQIQRSIYAIDQLGLNTLQRLQGQGVNVDGMAEQYGLVPTPVTTTPPATDVVDNPMPATTTPTASPDLGTSASLAPAPAPTSTSSSYGTVRGTLEEIEANLQSMYGPKPTNPRQLPAWQANKQRIDQQIEDAKDLLATWTRGNPPTPPVEPGDQARYYEELNRMQREQEAHDQARALLEQVGLIK